MIQNNVVTNNVSWDGDINTWNPPSDATMVIQAITPAIVWTLDSTKTDWILTQVIGVGDIGFTWNGNVLTTNQSKPAHILQPTTTGTKSA